MDSWLRFENERTRTEGEYLSARLIRDAAILCALLVGGFSVATITVMARHIDQLEREAAKSSPVRYPTATTKPTGWAHAVSDCLTYEREAGELTWRPCADGGR